MKFESKVGIFPLDGSTRRRGRVVTGGSGVEEEDRSKETVDHCEDTMDGRHRSSLSPGPTYPLRGPRKGECFGVGLVTE